MARPRVFISSTFYDLKTVRLELDKFLKSLGYESVRNERGDIPYGSTESMQSYCYKEISNIDILVSIIGSRFGSPSENDKNRSVSNMELKTAIEQNKHVFIFIEKSVFIEYETYLLNENSDKVKYRYVDDSNTYKFIKEIKALKANNNIKEFENVDDITSYLREQFAGLMKQFFIQEQRLIEINLIRGINSTASTLKELVDYIQNTNENQKENLKEIIKTFHPIIGELKEMLHIPYKFYIEDYKDLESLLTSRGFKLIESNQNDDFVFEKAKDSISSYRITIDKIIFDKDMNLKPFQPNEWKLSFINKDEYYDELLF